MNNIVTISRNTFNEEALAWAKYNCPGYITNDWHQEWDKEWDASKTDFFFTNEQEAMWFKLRWA